MPRPNSHSDITNIAGELIPPYETEKAFHFSDGKEKVWLPKSLCEWDEEEKTMAIPEWLAMDKGLI